jgi:hypothetical protein
MGHNIEQGAGGIDVLLKFKGFVASVPKVLKLIVAGNAHYFSINARQIYTV